VQSSEKLAGTAAAEIDFGCVAAQEVLHTGCKQRILHLKHNAHDDEVMHHTRAYGTALACDRSNASGPEASTTLQHVSMH
jgi:hypothetical protein